ncbi:MAG: twin-arginine translocase TatA/TatE family subunit [Micrococcaceae bacterium]
MRISPEHVLIIIAIALVVFGAPRLPGVAKNMGQSLRIFKSEVRQMKEEAEVQKEKAQSKAERKALRKEAKSRKHEAKALESSNPATVSTSEDIEGTVSKKILGDEKDSDSNSINGVSPNSAKATDTTGV